MSEPIQREEFNQSIQRVHDRIDKVESTTARIEVSASNIEKAADKLYATMFGNGKDGVIAKLAALSTRIKLHEGLLFFILMSIVGGACFVVRAYLVK